MVYSSKSPSSSLLLLLLLATSASAFTIPSSSSSRNAILISSSKSRTAFSITTTTTKTTKTAHAMISPDIMQDAMSSSSSLVLSRGDTGELLKSVIIVLAFGGGLIPAALAANKAMLGTLQGKRRGGEMSAEDIAAGKQSLDPTRSTAPYITSSGASGPTLPNSALLFASEDIPLVDIIAVVGRIGNVNDIADWRNLPSALLPGTINKENPPMWLPRATFKANVRNLKFLGWPVDQNGNPVGGADLEAAEKNRISKANVVIGDAALDAVFDTWAWGASVATPDKVGNELAKWREGRDGQLFFDVGSFTKSAIAGRSITGLAALTFVVIQVIAYGTLFIAPFLREFANVDIGFGQMGSCDPETCLRVLDVFN